MYLQDNSCCYALQARVWFNGLEAAIFSLDEYPSRGAVIPEDKRFRHLLYGNKPHIYRIIYAIDETSSVVTVLHIRHGARQPLAAQSDRQSRVPGR